MKCLKIRLLNACLVMAAAITFTFTPAIKQEEIKEVNVPILYADPNPGGG